MHGSQNAELTRDERTDQTVGAIALLNRLTVAEIRLKRASLLSDGFGTEMKEIRENIHSLTDSLLLGEDVRSNLNIIDQRVTKFEQAIDA